MTITGEKFICSFARKNRCFLLIFSPFQFLIHKNSIKYALGQQEEGFQIEFTGLL